MDLNNVSESDLLEMLSFSNYNPDNYDDWIQVGMIMKLSEDRSNGNDVFRDAWEKWSAKSQKYDSVELEKKWRSFKKGDGVGFGTLYKKAKEGGWREPEMSNKEYKDFKWDDDISYDGEEPVYSSDPVENVRRKAEETQKKEPVIKEPTENSDNSTQDNLTTEEEKLIQALLAESGSFTKEQELARHTLKSCEEGQLYCKSRGFSEETLDHYDVGWVTALPWGNYGEGGNYTGLMIPGTPEGYGIRNVRYEERKAEIEKMPEEQRQKAKKNNSKYFKPSTKKGGLDIPVGLKFVVREPDLRDETTGYPVPIFIVEGYCDVMSIYEATGIDGISLNGVQNIGKVITALRHFHIDRPIVLLLDHDDTGNDKNKQRYNDLKNAGFDVTREESFYGDYKDANEFLVNDRDGFIEAIENAKRLPFSRFDKFVNKNQKDNFLNYIRESVNRPVYKTGFKTLDSSGFLNGGLRAGLYGIGAVSSLGKTSFVLQLADNLAKDGIPVLYFSIEMSRNELIAKSISRYASQNSYDREKKESEITFSTMEILDGKKLKKRDNRELEFLDSCIDLYFNETGDNIRILEARDLSEDGDVTVEEIEMKVKEQATLTHQAPVVIVDYLQILSQSDQKKNMTDKQFLDRNIRYLKQISVKYDTPVIFISSFNRQSNNKSADFDSFLGTSGIEYSADVLIALERDTNLSALQEERSKDNESAKYHYAQNIETAKKKERGSGVKWLRLKILKHRIGESLGVIKLAFHAKNNLFIDCGEIIPEVESEDLNPIESEFKQTGKKAEKSSNYSNMFRDLLKSRK